MTDWLWTLLEVILLSSTYWVVDALIREEGYVKAFQKIFKSNRIPMVALPFALAGGLSLFWNWSHVSSTWSDPIRWLLLGINLFLGWQALTKDIDPVQQNRYQLEKSLLALSLIGLWYSPAFGFVSVFLLTYPFAIWQHHATLPMRLNQLILSYLFISAVPYASVPWESVQGLFSGIGSFVFLLVVMQASHYFITALAKSFLGPKWYSWMIENKIHHLAASAYSWGWARFLPWKTWKKVIDNTKKVERPMQFFAYGIEFLAPLALLHPYGAIGLSVAWAGFHVGVFSLSGLLFWDWILTDLLIATFLYALPIGTIEAAFGWQMLLAGLVYMAIFPLRHKLWKPMPLGWYDTPLTQRVHWKVQGESGQWYGLYNNFMCPHERLYGKVNGCFMVPEPVLTYHLGECWKPELRDRIRKLLHPDVDVSKELQNIKKDYGISPTCDTRTENHKLYLQAFFSILNKGYHKGALPKFLKWLKAPGDQLFYWGELAPYKGQEKVAKVEMLYREEIFRDGKLERLSDQVLETIAIPESMPQETLYSIRELTPKEVDDFLLEHAQGRLLDLPGFKQNYLRGDDGKVVLSHS